MDVDMPNKALGNKALATSEGVLTNIRFLEKWLDVSSILAFSETCQAAQRISYEHLNNLLLTAVVCGDEDLARKIVTSNPKLLLASSAIGTDLSGKKIKYRTPLEAAIRAGDVEMAQMIVDVLHKKLQAGIRLSFEPELEMQRQFTAIYPNGVDAVETTQQLKAQEFKTSMLNAIFNAINTATAELVENELDTPGQNNPDSQLNVALHNFREQFIATSNRERIFNPFYLLMAFEFYDEKFGNFSGNEHAQWNRRNLFWRQIIGYTQRHLPACYLQAFAQSIYDTVMHKEKLTRDFKFRYYEGAPPCLGSGNMGYMWAVSLGAQPTQYRGEGGGELADEYFQKLLRTKKSGLENLFTHRVAGNYSYLPSPCVIA